MRPGRARWGDRTVTELLPPALAFAAVFGRRPFAFSHYRESSAVDDEVDWLVRRHWAKRDFEALTTT
jgi:hypothetical protein